MYGFYTFQVFSVQFPSLSIVSLRRLASGAHTAERLLEDMRLEKLQPGVVTMNSLITACGVDHWPQALQHLRGMTHGTAVTQGAILTVMARQLQWRTGLELLPFLRRMASFNEVVATKVCQPLGVDIVGHIVTLSFMKAPKWRPTWHNKAIPWLFGHGEPM